MVEDLFKRRLMQQEDMIVSRAFILIVISLFIAGSAFAANGQLPIYKVYDATHRGSVGTTDDGVNVTAKFQGHDVIFVIRAGGSDNPDFANALGIVYAQADCKGDAYVADFGDSGMDPDYPIMDGVLPIVSAIGKLPEAATGEYVYGDPHAQATIFHPSPSTSFFPVLFANGQSECINGIPFQIYGLPAVELTIDWQPPLSIRKK
jgi:hypothetical protein